MRVLAPLLVLLVLGCVPAEAIKQAETEQAINKGHAADESLDASARLIGRTNYDAWSAQLYSLDGTPLPEDVAARLEARGAPSSSGVGE